MDDVAREARVSRPTVYRHFPGGRDALLRDVVAWESARFVNDLTRAVGVHTELRADVDVDRAADHLARMLLSVVSSPGGWDVKDRDVVVGMVERWLVGPLL